MAKLSPDSREVGSAKQHVGVCTLHTPFVEGYFAHLVYLVGGHVLIADCVVLNNRFMSPDWRDMRRGRKDLRGGSSVEFTEKSATWPFVDLVVDRLCQTSSPR